jgi:hypothetical protein
LVGSVPGQQLTAVLHVGPVCRLAGRRAPPCWIISNRAEQLRLLIRRIETNDEGAFAPLSQQPLVGALLMPFGGAGILALLEYLATMH